MRIDDPIVSSIESMDTLSPPPQLVHLFTLRAAVDAPIDVGFGPYGQRRCIPITSGSVQGKVKGSIVPGGADYMCVSV